MSENFGSPSPTQPLSIGNVVSAAVRLYRSHLKEYFLLALRAYIWLIIPIYGWAKFYALTALISRLAFGELVNQPESISSGERFVNSRLWQFLVVILLLFLVGMGIGLAALILFVLLGVLSAALVGGIGQQGNPATYLLFGLLAFVVGIAALVAVLWLVTRFYLVDLPLAVEDNVNGASAISRSWDLTQGHVWRILLISFVAFLITVPLQIIVQILTSILQVLFASVLQQESGIFTLVFFLLVLALSFSSGAVIVPFWQTVKAVIYYDLRSRREGLGLKLRDREI
ncbi:glycerophosphoryl diester phosphodiesterase membrane domain-containing protein [Nostocaceae cyanobacterium CENA357]|uniref:Glycerophosphoryl diester phosphodiesterase membrane domain-containing protein n=1 Tax=Atlanticothrix silvestris CENA357 TaxID=1725252 RepID=A0A8J7HEZ3_9CYAN|nr:glycerophosphoryl diester phosphodiesterase membrane domain-containing protein [Atlanticothrix silvestris]MBH8553962.1 glycerophosphoryl diester phosphodiesterase membrane domain-containing protein [Atlanticothrix silvestris CENA357]